MCTTTWVYHHDGYELWFNRDELRSRGRGRAPEVLNKGIPYIAPRDSDSGGTWIAVNSRGLTVAILNYYQGTPPESADFRSRGLLVSDMAPQDGILSVQAALAKVDLARYRPFEFLAVDTSGVKRFLWTGERFTTDEPAPPLSSSSYRTDAVVAHRKVLYDSYKATEQEKFHRSAVGPESAFWVCMTRSDALTHSISRIVVDARRVRFWYGDAESEYRFPEEPVEIPRATGAGAESAG